MLEQDYIMRLIKQMVGAILKVLFHIDTEQPEIELVTDQEQREALGDLLAKIDAGDINEAEDALYLKLDANDLETLKMAMIFYSYLNEKDEEFLQTHAFSREEIRMGIKETASRFGYGSMVDVFLEDL